METFGTTSLPEGLAAKVVTHTELEHSDEWRRAFQNKCKDHRFYEIMEETLANDFDYRYWLLQDAEGRLRAIQPMFFVQQSLVEGVPGKARALVELIRRRFPRFLTMRVLMVGCAAGEGHLGACDPKDENSLATALHRSLRAYARKNKAALVVLKDFPAKYRQTLSNFSTNGYARVPSMPMTRLPLKYASFDDYLATLGYITRKSLRRKFRKTERAAKIEMEVVHDIGPCIDEVYPLYLQVHQRSPMRFEQLTKESFVRLGQTMPERARFFIWRQEGRIVAFSCCLIHDGKIYDECLGLDYRIALDLHLYFYTLRDVLTWAIKNGLKEYCSGPLNYDPKLHLGCELVPLDLYVMHTRGFLNPIFRHVLKYLEPTRHDPVLRKFPNANEL
ncbi:MAG TPA: GNAT family N-acetyltransferase [Chthoniobacterales bacterium]|nr:GNAT family N-acetyltransferase [Chthoniobacterales bacterium]